MNFNHLEYAVAVAKSGSISKAAQRLFLSQPYLSGMIKGLEEELGYRIFERNKAGVELTELGEEFIKSAKLILLELQKIRELFRPMTIYAIMSRSHPLAEGRQLSIQDLFQYPYVSYEDESSRQYLKLLGLEAHP